MLTGPRPELALWLLIGIINLAVDAPVFDGPVCLMTTRLTGAELSANIVYQLAPHDTAR